MGQDSCCWAFVSCAVRGLYIGEFHRIVPDVHHRLSDFIHAVVVHRWDEATRGRGIGLGRNLWCIPISGSDLTSFPRLPFFCASLILLLVVLGVLADPD